MKDTRISTRMQKEYMGLLNIGLKSINLDELKRIRNVFTDEKVVEDYKNYFRDRLKTAPKILEILTAKERLSLCLTLIDQKGV